MHFLAGLALFLVYPLASWAAVNTTIQYNDASITYNPNATWSDWPPSGCNNWTGGRWPSEPASIELKFKGTAVYAYAAFEYNIPPVYTIQVDGGNTVNSGSLPPLSSICDPIYVNTNLPDGDHTLKLVVTNDDPLHISDFIFLGFIVTQSLGDTIPFPTGIGGSGNSGSASPSSTSTGGGFHLFGGSGHVVETSHTLLLAGFASLAAILL